MEHELIRWLVRYGAPLLFFAQVFGIFGVPIPDELLMTISGALIAKGVLRGSTTVTAAVSGCLVGISISYALGRGIGSTLLRPRFDHHRRAIDRAQSWFRRFGHWLLAFGYFIPGVRHVTAIIAGSGCMPYRTFAAYAYPGGVAWCAVFLSLGYVAGDRWHDVERMVRSQLAIGAIALAVFVGLVYFVFTMIAQRIAQRRRA